MEEQLALVDVHTDTVADTWPLVLEAVQRASFIALDLELSGLGSTYTQAEYVTIATGLLTADHISSTIDY